MDRAKPTGSFVRLADGEWYRIRDYDRMEPFFISVVSSGDHWIFASTTGGISSGRRSADMALFPYYTEDKVADSYASTGSLTIMIVEIGDERKLWKPFSEAAKALYRVERELLKSAEGDRLRFVERNLDLGIEFSYCWASSDVFGILREARLVISPDCRASKVHTLDGVRNILPAGITVQLQNEWSCLLDAYKKSELDEASGLALYRLSSLLTDKAEPSEALRANSCFGASGPGCPDPEALLLSERQVRSFEEGSPIETERDSRGLRGAYLTLRSFDVKVAEYSWLIAMDVDLDHSGFARLAKRLATGQAGYAEVLADSERGKKRLLAYIGAADGIQTGGDRTATAHHYANALFNIMRGGIFPSGYEVGVEDFVEFLARRNKAIASRSAAFLGSLPERINRSELEAYITAHGDPQLSRLFREYLPLGFSRRHGDPSRPWNRFLIDVQDAEGRPRLNYQGNWRDIFQNWEALAYSFPGWLPHMISRFLCATSPDGYNPYRITRDGLEWEVPEPGNPWANIGYWQDHQIVYLGRLIEAARAHYPGTMEAEFLEPRYTWADIPYRIRKYDSMLKDYRSTIMFDHKAHEAIEERTKAIGNDGKFVLSVSGEPFLSSMAEKLVSLILAKIANFVPGGGLWMNTQRPEWNDANNALVGPGLSMVSLCQARKFSILFAELLEASGAKEIELAEALADFLEGTLGLLRRFDPAATSDPAQRRSFMDAMGAISSRYRERAYARAIAGPRTKLATDRLSELLRRFIEAADLSIALNRREDGLYHSYNLLRLESGAAHVERLYEMLEGQVALLSSGYLGPQESLSLLKALRGSRLYREDQRSYMLYPDRELPRFASLNAIPAEALKRIGLLARLAAEGGGSLIKIDVEGRAHFDASLRNAGVLSEALDRLAEDARYSSDVTRDKEAILALYESMFKHISFTGRSGTFFGYEGLGSIYWHMVAKLMLASQEALEAARRQGSGRSVIEGLEEAYRHIRSGLGYKRDVVSYGAFPHDPYSHTPKHSGARQPGMTGQVKEELITRRLELGLTTESGKIRFRPELIEEGEFLTSPATHEQATRRGGIERIDIAAGSLCFSAYGIPVVIAKAKEPRVRLVLEDDSIVEKNCLELSIEESKAIFDGEAIPSKNARVTRIELS